MKVKCPKCNGDTTVLETRQRKDGMSRRRMCIECGNRFSTMESIKEKAIYKKMVSFNGGITWVEATTVKKEN